MYIKSLEIVIFDKILEDVLKQRNCLYNWLLKRCILNLLKYMHN